MIKENFTGKDFLTLLDYTPEEVEFIINTAAELKRDILGGTKLPDLSGNIAAMVLKKNPPEPGYPFRLPVLI